MQLVGSSRTSTERQLCGPTAAVGWWLGAMQRAGQQQASERQQRAGASLVTQCVQCSQRVQILSNLLLDAVGQHKDRCNHWGLAWLAYLWLEQVRGQEGLNYE